MKTRLSVAVVSGLFVLWLPTVAHAGACTKWAEVVPDGRVSAPVDVTSTDDLRVVLRGVGGHSYSVQVTQLDFFNNISVFFGPAGNACATADIAGLRRTEAIDPVVDPSTSERGSFTATIANFYAARVAMSNGTHAVTYTVSDTTLYNPHWSTFGGFFTSWGFHNTTNATINGNLRVINSAGTEVANVNFAIPSGTVVFRDTRSTDLNLAAQQAGSAIFTHDGPPGAIQADAFFLNGDASVVVPSEFKPIREAAH